MTNLEPRKHAYNEIADAFTEGRLDRYERLREMLDYLHAATVEECIGLMPEEDENFPKPWNDYRAEAISRLQALIATGTVEGGSTTE